MARKKIQLEEAVADVNIMPLMNIVMLLIPFLIMSAEFIRIGVINVNAPKLQGPSSDSTPTKVKKKPLNLTVSVTSRGYTLITRGNKIPQGCNLSKESMNAPNKKLPTVPKIDDKYDNKKLRECMGKIKKLFPSEQRVIIMAEPKIQYRVIIGIMDHSRISKDDKELFPQVVLSAGVI